MDLNQATFSTGVTPATPDQISSIFYKNSKKTQAPKFKPLSIWDLPISIRKEVMHQLRKIEEAKNILKNISDLCSSSLSLENLVKTADVIQVPVPTFPKQSDNINADKESSLEAHTNTTKATQIAALCSIVLPKLSLLCLKNTNQVIMSSRKVNDLQALSSFFSEDLDDTPPSLEEVNLNPTFQKIIKLKPSNLDPILPGIQKKLAISYLLNQFSSLSQSSMKTSSTSNSINENSKTPEKANASSESNKDDFDLYND